MIVLSILEIFIKIKIINTDKKFEFIFINTIIVLKPQF